MVSDFDQLFYADSYQTVFSAKVTDQNHQMEILACFDSDLFLS